MDIRLKNNKKALRTAAVIVTLAAAAFALIVLDCRYQVSDYYARRGSDFESEPFIDVLFQWNYVLYPEVLEKGGERVSTEELYLSFDEEEVSQVNMDDYYGTELVYQGGGEQLRAEYLSEMQNSLLRIDSLYTTEISTRMDYCVIDEKTGTVLKNTARDIEQLRDEENPGYVYYLMVCYDANGSISDVRVSGSDSEQFLKSAQLVANSSNSPLLDDRQKVLNYVLVNESDVVDHRMTITQKNPRNAVFIYAMTEKQRENFSWFPIYRYDGYDTVSVQMHIGTDDVQTVYEYVGVGRWYQLFLAGITVIVGILARYRKQYMADTAGTRRCAELILAVQWILFIVCYSLVVTLAYVVNELYATIPPIDFLILFGVMIVVFGAWYWCLLSIRGIFGGVRVFLRERSLTCRYWQKIKRFAGERCNRWKESLASVDLGKNTTGFLKRLVVLQCLLLSLVCCLWGFGIFLIFIYSIALYFALRWYIARVQRGYRNLLQATNAIAQGKFDNTFEGDFGIFESYKEELYQIQGGFRTAVEEEVKSQRMKTELITNVSHDLKTPLTAIITYTDLLKGENLTDEQRRSYLETLERKSLRLKVLIEDLFEISKASSGNVKLEPVAVDICNLIRQVYLEHEDRMTSAGLEIRFDMPEEKIILQLDSQKTYRIFENLYVNITKYALPNTRVYVQVKVNAAQGEHAPAGTVHIELKNISAQELTVNPTDLTERFVRGDASRNSEGSGLGLAIAKSFTELQSGRFGIGIDGDLFKAVIEWGLPASGKDIISPLRSD